MRQWLHETHNPFFELFRHFLRNFFSNDLVSNPRQAHAAALIAIVPVLFQWFFLLIMPLNAKYAHLSALPNPGPYRDAVRADELWLITLMMGCIGLLTAIKWQALFPDLSDYRCLGTLPLGARQIFGAKLAALLLVAAITLLMINSLPSLTFPFISQSRWAINEPLGLRLRAHLCASLAGCAFLFFSIVALQGVLLNVLPPRAFGRVGGLLQGALIALTLAAIVVSFSIQPQVTQFLMNPVWGRWVPPIWFLGLYEKLVGTRDAYTGELAHFAIRSILLVIVTAFSTYVLSYHRHRTLLVEGLTSSANRLTVGSILTRGLFFDPRQQAVAGFMWQTISRSGRHRTILMGYAGLSLAVILTGFIGVEHVVRPERVAAADFICFHVFAFLFFFIGIRHLFSIPTELKANWIFQITENEGRGAWLRAVDRFALCWGALLLLIVPFPLKAQLLGWRSIAETTIMGGLGLISYERIFFIWEKLPFTCSRLAGQTPTGIILAFLGLLGAVAVLQSLLIELLFHDAALVIAMAVSFAVCIYLDRRRRADWAELPLKYEELPEPAVHALNLLK